MASAVSVRFQREKLEHELRMDMLRAEEELKQAAAEKHHEAFQRYLDALSRFSSVAVYGRVPEEDRS
jgi:hypothetical protein